ncbi:MAG: 4-(cytidine 5'-diphospho)-2-C-methyl-D-erythritol kinase [Gammaproteobacteria bacterium]|nr:4-(cytidine 5'-diphospho)-2-C-methyl-D-erythritol kinase [Sideroxydans sp.]MBU3904067.1 4-(cytidine 5'-diphospho)-2-C-methyl-D-erythritol kinase [Gammaproteobacteria bacterium]MBU4044811.1 4-(cytidine 5'-diphospho)-2-C-methyl-D-erythritol kinase [Gammaproteobacteria bacterium]MBU4150358.1 4-(cytidine 5'-diphospho)-2-C-methyl-D-erythritol kinase [Gammaproteobacteria bacterium]
MKTLVCPAPAKLNLFLHVVGRREDGYHLLQTLFRFIDLNDTLHFTLRDDGQVCRLNALEGVPPEQDLCVRAARLLQQETGCKLGADIEVEKRIPMGGGLGGGSSDAATTLLALNKLWGLGLSRERLMALGLTLGADVPVFVFGDNAFAEGVGERLQAYGLPEAWYVVLCPPVHVPTAKIFTHSELTRNTISMTMRALPKGEVFRAGRQAGLNNDLQAVACKLYPEVAEHLAWLAQFAPAMMTGSGACVFAEFATESEAKAVLQQLPPDMRGFVAHGLQQHPLREFAA